MTGKDPAMAAARSAAGPPPREGRPSLGRRLLRPLLIACGSLCVGLALLGILIPLLPTTPFLLLAAFCYARSSRRFYDWLLGNRWFGVYLRNYREGRGIPLRQKIVALTALWLTIGYAAAALVPPLWGKALLVAIAAAVTLHLLTIPTWRPDRETAPGAGEPAGERGGKDEGKRKEPAGNEGRPP